jgi:hypothetical protein
VEKLAKSRYVGILFALAILVSACGGDDGTADPGEPSTNDTEQAAPADDGATDTTASAEEPADDDDNEPVAAGPVNVATVTIGDETYEADMTPGTLQRCDPDFFNAFWALGEGLELFLPPPDDPNHTDGPRIKVKDDASGLEWVADPTANQVGATAIPEGDSQVDSFTVVGNTATGTATFIEQEAFYKWTGGGDQPEPVKGTFEVTCEKS